MGYEKGIIYAIEDNETHEVYVGSTINGLIKRMWDHKSPKNRCTSKPIIERCNYEYYIIEAYPCQTKDQLRAREEYHRIRVEKCVNQIKCGFLTQEERETYNTEWKKNWYLRNKTELRQESKKKYKENEEYREAAKQRASETYTKLRSTEEGQQHLRDRGNAWYHANKAKVAEKVKARRFANIEAAKVKEAAKREAQRAIRTDCDCGGKYSEATKFSHFKTKRHIAYVENQLVA
jgi:hypothetical protein